MCAELLHMFHDQELAVVIYKTKIILLINCKDISSDRFPWPPWYFVCHYLILGSCGMVIKTCGAVLIITFITSISVFKLIQYINSHASMLVFAMPIWLICSWFIAFYCSVAGMIILPLMAIPSMITILSLNDQQGCSSFHICFHGWPTAEYRLYQDTELFIF